jgi:hypothetical protein
MLDMQGRHGRKMGNSLHFNQGKIWEENETVGLTMSSNLLCIWVVSDLILSMEDSLLIGFCNFTETLRQIPKEYLGKAPCLLPNPSQVIICNNNFFPLDTVRHVQMTKDW